MMKIPKQEYMTEFRELRGRGFPASKERVGRLMRENDTWTAL